MIFSFCKDNPFFSYQQSTSVARGISKGILKVSWYTMYTVNFIQKNYLCLQHGFHSIKQKYFAAIERNGNQ